MSSLSLSKSVVASFSRRSECESRTRRISSKAVFSLVLSLSSCASLCSFSLSRRAAEIWLSKLCQKSCARHSASCNRGGRIPILCRSAWQFVRSSARRGHASVERALRPPATEKRHVIRHLHVMHGRCRHSPRTTGDRTSVAQSQCHVKHLGPHVPLECCCGPERSCVLRSRRHDSELLQFVGTDS